MRSAIHEGIGFLVCCLLVVPAGQAAAQTPAIGAMAPQCGVVARPVGVGLAARPGAQQVYNDKKTRAVFFFSSTDDGAARMTVSAGALQVEKDVYSDGRFRTRLQTGEDVVTIVGRPGQVQIDRAKERGRSLEVGRASEDEWLQLKVLLAGSKAVRLFRAFADSVDSATLETPAGAGLLMTDTLLALLDGDRGAVTRVGERWRAAKQAKIRPAALGQAQFLGCYANYVEAALETYYEYFQCKEDSWVFDLLLNVCWWEWAVKSESVWFQFIGCSMFPLG